MSRFRYEFSIYDYILFAAMLIISLAIGIYHAFVGTCQKTTGEFLTGNRNMKLFPIAISIMTSFISAILILGTPAEMYTAGTLYMIYIIGACIGCLLASLCFVPLIYPLKLTSTYEYLEQRFQSRSVKLIATGLCILQQVIYLGIASYAPSTALNAVTDFPEGVTILIVVLVATIYTCLGGIKAVVWSDVFQAFVMIAGILAIVIQGTLMVGGMKHVWEVNYKWGRIRFNEFQPDPTVRHTFWNLLCGATISWMSILGTSQASVQRYSSLPTLKKARLSILINIVAVSMFIFLACLAGIVVFSYYATKGCDPLTSKQIDNSNQIIPLFVMEVLGYPGLPGLFIACLFSGALSSVSSSLNGLAAITWEGFLKVPCKELSEARKALITRFLVVIFGAIGVSCAFIARKLGGTVLQASLSFTGASGGPMTGLFILGAIFPWANWKGAVAGGTFGLILPLWISIGSYMYDSHKSSLPFPVENCNTTQFIGVMYLNETEDALSVEKLPAIAKMYKLSYLWYSSIGIVGCVCIGLVVSFITGPNKASDIDPKYLIPVFDRICCYLPRSCREKSRCRLDFVEPKFIDVDVKGTYPDGPKPRENMIYAMSDGSVHLNSLSHKNGVLENAGCTNTAFGATMDIITQPKRLHDVNSCTTEQGIVTKTVTRGSNRMKMQSVTTQYCPGNTVERFNINIDDTVEQLHGDDVLRGFNQIEPNQGQNDPANTHYRQKSDPENNMAIERNT